MLLYEILEPARTLTATVRFKNTFKEFKQSFPIIDSVLRRFVEFRLSHRIDEPYANKDSAFSVHNELRGFRHLHMVHGKVILIYQITQPELRLCLVTDHGYSTTSGTSRLISLLHAPNVSYEPVAVEQPRTLSAAQIAAIDQLFYEFAADDRASLTRAIHGHLDELQDFMRLIIDDPWTDAEKDRAIFSAFGGEAGLIKTVQRILQQTTLRT